MMEEYKEDKDSIFKRDVQSSKRNTTDQAVLILGFAAVLAGIVLISLSASGILVPQLLGLSVPMLLVGIGAIIKARNLDPDQKKNDMEFQRQKEKFKQEYLEEKRRLIDELELPKKVKDRLFQTIFAGVNATELLPDEDFSAKMSKLKINTPGLDGKSRPVSIQDLINNTLNYEGYQINHYDTNPHEMKTFSAITKNKKDNKTEDHLYVEDNKLETRSAAARVNSISTKETGVEKK